MKNQNEVLRGVISLITPRKKKKYAIHMDLLAAKLLTTSRKVRYAVEEIRRNDLITGYVLVGDLKAGYWITKDESEIENWLGTYLSNAFSMIKTAKTAKKYVSRSRMDKFQKKLQF